eukprot:6180357-Pleurochrysis_carterae.AAC.2
MQLPFSGRKNGREEKRGSRRQGEGEKPRERRAKSGRAKEGQRVRVHARARDLWGESGWDCDTEGGREIGGESATRRRRSSLLREARQVSQKKRQSSGVSWHARIGSGKHDRNANDTIWNDGFCDNCVVKHRFGLRVAHFGASCHTFCVRKMCCRRGLGDVLNKE